MTTVLYLEGRCKCGNLHVSTPSFMALFTLSCFEYSLIKVVIVDINSKDIDRYIHKLKGRFSFEFKTVKECPIMIQNCKLPAAKLNGKDWCTSGLSSTVRHILHEKLSVDQCNIAKRLLGFRSGCLQACAEVSVWTKFCEVEVTEMVDKLLVINCRKKNIVIPEELVRFENHLKQPPITHNILKKKQQTLGKNLANQELAQLKRMKLDELPPLEHKYAEGLDLTLADLFIFSTFSFLFMFPSLVECIDANYPLTKKWYNMVKSEKILQNALTLLNTCTVKMEISCDPLVISNLPEESLYKADTSRYNPRSRAYTNQKDIDFCMEKLSFLKFNVTNTDIKNFTQENNTQIHQNTLNSLKEEREYKQIIDVITFKFDDQIKWEELPTFVNLHGQLPAKRLVRKQEQLENMALAVLAIAKPGNVIVDFCSGSGHLGILLAYCLPHCKVLLVENKEESLSRAFNRVSLFGLKNIEFYHCNLDYFYGSFDIGVCLHACGVATDLVLKNCVESKASFVCSPCCYGSIQTNHILEYPRSKTYRSNYNLMSDNYFILSHAADQTHDEKNVKTAQGRQCMRLVDNDRLSYAQEAGYKTILAEMNPPSCSPKNHILIGLYEKVLPLDSQFQKIDISCHSLEV